VLTGLNGPKPFHDDYDDDNNDDGYHLEDPGIDGRIILKWIKKFY
jgi:hypothetical protein